jgi:hypothetical protein
MRYKFVDKIEMDFLRWFYHWWRLKSMDSNKFENTFKELYTRLTGKPFRTRLWRKMINDRCKVCSKKSSPQSIAQKSGKRRSSVIDYFGVSKAWV